MKRFYMSVLLIVSLFLFLPIAEGATDNYVVSVPKVQGGSENARLGTLVIEEDIHSFTSGDIFNIVLPSGVQYSSNPTSPSTSVSDYVYCDDSSVQCDIISGDLQRITVRLNVNEATADSSENKLFIYFGGNRVNSPSAINIGDSVTGDIKVIIDGLDSRITSGEYLIGRAAEYGVTVSTGNMPTIQSGTVQNIADITFQELCLGSLIENRTISLTLPEWASWNMIDEDSDQNVELRFEGYSDEEKRIAKWTVLGTSTHPATLTLEDMKVLVEDGHEESLVVEVGGSAGVTGSVIVAEGVAQPTEFPFTIDPNITVMDNSFDYTNNIKVGQQHYVGTDISNISGSPKAAIIVCQILDGNGEQVEFSAIKGIFSPGQICNYSIMWKPIQKGTYKANVFVWSNWLTNNGKPLAKKQSIDIAVN